MYHRSNNEYGANAWEVQRPRPARPQSAGVAGTRGVGTIGGVATGTAYYQRSSDVYGGFSQSHVAAAHNTRAVSAGIAPPAAAGGHRTRATGGAGPSSSLAAATTTAATAAPGRSNPGVNKALIVGINYIGTSCPLGGCVNDAKAALASLQKWGFNPKDAGNFMMLVEEGDKKNWPYKKNIEAGFKWLLQDVKEGDVLWLHFSGHGTQVTDKTGDEADGQAGLIVDDDVKRLLVDPLPKGATLYCVFDCCHSGTIIDARFQYDAKTKKMTINGGDSPTAGMVMMISGCMDAQTSADLPPGFDKMIKESVGALSGCLYPMISQKKSWSALVEEVRKKLKTSKLEQIPQLSASRDFDLDGTAFGYAFKDFVPPPPVVIDPTMPAFGIDRAVVVGINYIGTNAALSGCINDAHSAISFLKRNGLKDKPRDSYVLLTEEKGELRPTRKNILKAFHWLTKGSKPGETLWFHFSGHGSQGADVTGDEADGMDETLCPVDYEAAGMITDDDIRSQLVETLPKGVALYVVMDCCHSGTILDLRFGLDAKAKTMTIDDKCKASEPLVVMISGCMDEQESADLPPGFIQGNMDKSVGALSGILYPLLDKKMSWFDLIDKVRKDLKKSKLPQVPQLQSSKDLDLAEVAFRRIWSTK